jgi:hypothetical protein
MIDSNGYYDDTLSLEDAVTYLRKLYAEFPFADWREDSAGLKQSRSQDVQIAAMLSQFGVGLIPKDAQRLGFIYNANSQRSGKTLLAKMAIVPTNGMMATQSWNPKEEELRKVLDAEVLRASRYIVFDNVRGHIASQVLEGFFTAPIWTGRILGKSQMYTSQNTASIFITGNYITVSPDMNFRCLTCDLFVEEANVLDRQIKTPIDDAWLMSPKNRKDMLSAMWAIVRHWDAAGHPKASQHLRQGFERWCETFAGLTMFAGFGNPLLPPSEGELGVDNETTDMRSLVQTMAQEILSGEQRRTEFTFQNVVNLAHQAGLFDWILDGKESEGNYVLKPDANSKFGKLMKKYAPLVTDQKGPRFRLWRFDTDVGRKAVRTSCTGKDKQRRYVVEQPTAASVQVEVGGG